MAEVVTLDLELINKISGPANQAAAVLRRLEQQQDKTQAAIDRATTRGAAKQAAAWDKVQRALMKQNAAARDAHSFDKQLGAAQAKLAKLQSDPGGYKAMLKAQKAVRDQQEKLRKETEHPHGFLASFRQALPFRSVGDYAKGAFWGHLAAEGVEKIVEGLTEGAVKVVEILYDGIKDAFKAIGQEQALRSAYKLTLGGEKGDAAREDIERFSKGTAFSASQNQEQMLPLFRAGLRDKDARSTYAAALDLAAGRGRGADKGAVNEAVELFARIQQKGAITGRQLAGIGLGETNLPKLYKNLGATLGISSKEAEKRASKAGGVDPLILRNAIFDAIEAQQGGKLGTGANTAGASLQGQYNKLTSLPEEYLRKLTDSPALPKLSEKVGEILESLSPDSPNGERILSSLMAGFQRVVDGISKALTPENIDRFVNGVTKAVDIASRLPDLFAKVLDIVETIIDVIGAFKNGGTGGTVGNDDEAQKAKREGKVQVNHWWGVTYEDAATARQPTDAEGARDTRVPGIPEGGARGAGGGVVLNQNGQVFHVTLPPGQDPKEAGKKFGEGNTKGTLNQLERAAQERGGT